MGNDQNELYIFTSHSMLHPVLKWLCSIMVACILFCLFALMHFGKTGAGEFFCSPICKNYYTEGLSKYTSSLNPRYSKKKIKIIKKL